MEKKPEDSPVSLSPLSPEEALRALLAVKPEASDEDASRQSGESD